MRISAVIIIFILLASSAAALESVPVKHTYVVTSRNPEIAYRDKNTLFSGVYCSRSGTETARAYLEFDPEEVRKLDEKPYYYLAVHVAQKAENVCQNRKRVEYLEVYSVSDLKDNEKITWNDQPKKERYPLDARLILSDSRYYFQIPTRTIEGMKEKNRPVLLISAANDRNKEEISVKELRKNAKIEARDAPIIQDSDGDGLDDIIEVQLGTNAFSEDSDGDGIQDFKEVLNDLNPLKHGDIKEPDCSSITCPAGVRCSDGMCLVKDIGRKAEKAAEEAEKGKCTRRGGEECTLEEDCDGHWATDISGNCCFGRCISAQPCSLLEPELNTYETEQGDAVGITVRGIGCEGRTARVTINEMDGIGSEDEVKEKVSPVKIRNGEAKTVWLAEGNYDGLFGGRNEYRICVREKGSDEIKCTKKYLKVKQKPKESTCAAGDGCNIECANKKGDPDCLCTDLLEKRTGKKAEEQHICTSYSECYMPLLSSEGICCDKPCVSTEKCGNGICDEKENEISCPHDCKIKEPKSLTINFDGNLTADDGTEPSESKGGRFSNDSLSGMSLYGLKDGDYIEYPNKNYFYASQGTVSLWVKFDRFSKEDSAWFHTPDSMFVVYYDYCSSCKKGDKIIKGRAGGSETRYAAGKDWTGEWHQVILSWKGAPRGEAKLYIDGTPADSTEYKLATSADSFRIGNNYGLWMGWHDGKIDTMHIMNYAINDGQAEELYEKEKPRG